MGSKVGEYLAEESQQRQPGGTARGQPVVYNRDALELILPGLRWNGLVRQCLEFNVTHDVGNAIFHWMYSIPTARFRANNYKAYNKLPSHFRDDIIAHHGLGTSKELNMKKFHEL